MIVGVGTDIVAIARMQALWERHGERAADKILSPDERDACAAHAEPARLLAKRFAAKEALGKAAGSGLRAPLLMPDIGVVHDSLGKPAFVLYGSAATLFAERGWQTHLSISDEQDYAVAFVVLEQA